MLIGALASSYVNAGNLGIAVAAFVVGDTTVVVPTLLVQMLLVQPVALVVLDRLTGRGEVSARHSAACTQPAHRRGPARPRARAHWVGELPRV